MQKKLLTTLIALLVATLALGDITNGKYGEAQVFDTRRSSSCNNGGPTCDIWGFGLPYVGTYTNGIRVNWSTNDYLSFVLISGTDYRLVQYYDNGTQKEVVQNGGSILALGSGIVYLGSEGASTGYFISNSVGIDNSSKYTSSSTLKLTSTDADFDVTAADLANYPATTSILAPGVSAPNVAPIADNVTDNVTDNRTHNLNLGGYDVNGDNVTYTIVSTPSHGVFVLTDNQTGAFTFQPYDNLSAGQVLQDNLTFQITDNNSTTSGIYTYSFTITGENNPPTADNKSFPTGGGSITAPNLYTDNLSGSDFHGDNFTFIIASQPVYGNVTIVDNITGTFSYDPKGVPVGTFTDNFTYITRDNYSDDSEPAYVWLTVTGVNDPPEADNVSNNLTDNGTNNLTLGGGDPDGDNVTYTILSTPSYGSFVLTDNQTGAFTFQPYDNLSAGTVVQDNLTFFITDNSSTNSTIYTYSFTITGQNDVPEAFDSLTSDNFSDNGSVSFQLQGRDNDSSMDLTYVLVSDAQYGTTSLDNQTGLVTFTPYDNLSAGFFASDNVTFYVTDNLSNSTTQTYSFNVLGNNDVPVAENITSTASEGGATVLTLRGTDVDGDSITAITVLNTPSYGNYTLGSLTEHVPGNSTIQLTYTPYDNLSALTYTETISYQSTDNQSENSTVGTISLTVTGQNDPPTAQDNLTTATYSDSGSFSLQLSGADPDADDNLTYVLVSDAQYGTTSLDNQTGVLTYTPYDNLSAGFSAQDNVTFYVTDGLSNSTTQTYSFNVLGSNDVPAVANQTSSVSEGSSVVLTLNGSDVDGDSITAITVLNTPSYGTYTLGPLTELVPGNSTVQLTYTPFDNLSGASYNEIINYLVTDNQSENSTIASIKLTVGGQNAVPTAQDNFTSAVFTDNGSFSFQLSADDTDVGSVLSYVLVSGAQYGSVSLNNQTGEVSFTPYDNLSEGFLASDNVTFYATDGVSNSGIKTFSFNVLGGNDPPVAQDSLNLGNFTEDNAYSMNLNGSDVDQDNLTFTLVSEPKYGAISNFDSQSGSLTFTPYDNLSSGFQAQDNFSFLVTDNHSENSTIATVSFSVSGVNDLPAVTELTYVMQLGETESDNLSFDPVDAFDNHTFALVGNANFGTVVLDNASTGAFTYIPASDTAVSDNFTIRITDSDNATTESTIQIQINHPPQQSSETPADISLAVGKNISENWTFGDINSTDNLSVTLEGPSWLQPSTSGGNPIDVELLGSPTAAEIGEHSFKLVVTDSEGGRTEVDFDVTVGPDLITVSNDSQDSTLPTTFSSNGSSITGPFSTEIQMDGTVDQAMTMVAPIPAAGNKPETEIRATQNLDGTQSISLATKNPAQSAVTTKIDGLPAGAVTVISEDGGIRSSFDLGGEEVITEIEPNGELAITFGSADSCVNGQLTKVFFPEGTQTNVQANAMKNTVVPEPFTQSGIQQANLTIESDGSISSISDSNATGSSTTTQIPACSQTEVTYTGAVISTLPSVTSSLGEWQQVLTQNSEGEVEVKVELKDGTTDGNPILLPKMSPGSTVELLEESGVPKVKGEMSLFSNSQEPNARRGRVLTEADLVERYYMGRDPLTKEAVYLEAVTDDARVEVQRNLDQSLNEGKTLIIGKSGSSRIYRGLDTFPLGVGDTWQVLNGAQRISMEAGSTLLTFASEEQIKLADLEVRARGAHSIWAWDINHQRWLGYSPDLRRDVLIAEELQLSRMSKSMSSGSGIWIYSDTPIEILIPDAPPGEFPDTEQNQAIGWRFLGNNTDQPVTLAQLLTKLPPNVLNIWRRANDTWEVYDLSGEEQGRFGSWPTGEPLESGEGVWVRIETDESARNLRQPPQP